MLEFVFGLVLATSGLNDPGLQQKGLDGRTPERTPASALVVAAPPEAAGAPRGRRDLRD